VQPAFFHEPGQFALLATRVLADVARTRGRRIRLWSAGCGSGEEAWSMAMVVEEAHLPEATAVEIVATDDDAGALRCAADAVYDEDQMRRVTPARRRRHFVRGVGPHKGLWRVIAPLRDRVELDQLDLGGPWPAGPFDAVFCHAPLARLDAPATHRLARRLAEVIAPGGALFLGRPASDELPGLAPCGPASYRRPRRTTR
jgi:chemotaxis protein methyltransferase CheR